ncbi:MAG: hypothetical protein K2N65_02775, partial [Anaeroplasmataceae bacterium]|nr:hypothetical protein [Anaeroplasmataceae bacterium]
MKKLLMLICASCMLLGLTACKEKKEEHKEFKQGDIVIEDGVIYTYYSYENLYESIIPFVEEDTPKSYYNYYYYDMSSYKEQPAIVPFEGDLVESYDVSYSHQVLYNSNVFYNFLTYSNPIYSPQTAYFYRLIDYFSTQILGEGFIATGYTEQIKKDVDIPTEIENTPVIQIGFKAFENAPIETFTFMGNDLVERNHIIYNIIHPFAFSNCENLKTIKTNARVLSMGISNCPNLEEIYYITPTTDCSLYNLPKLKSIIDCNPLSIFLDYMVYFPEYRYTGTYYMDIRFYGACSGLRKSSIYLCPNLSELTGKDLSRRNNVVYIDRYTPFYAHENYTIMLRDEDFTNFSYRKRQYKLYNNNNEIYLPYLNNGLNYKGELFLDSESEAIKEEEDAFYVTTAYPKIIEGANFYNDDEYN